MLGAPKDQEVTGLVRGMNASLRESARQSIGTLGTLLYKDESKPRMPEKDWVELLRRIGTGDSSALGTLYMWTHGIVFALSMRILKDRSKAEDVTVEVFQHVWSDASGFDGTRVTVVAWIMNLARARATQVSKESK